RLNELKAVQEKLIAVMGQKSGFILAQLEAEGTKAPFSPYAQAPSSPAQQGAPQPPVVTAPKDQAAANPPVPNTAWSANLSQTPPKAVPRPSAPPAAQQALVPAAPKPVTPQPDNRVASLTPPGTDAPPISPATASGYTAEEIREAGKGVFGSLTSEFALLINHA